jgi:hypothetical protein
MLNKHQNGAATLLITIVLMLLITSAAVYTAKFSSQDVRINANDYRAKQAEAAAQAGVDHVTNILNKEDILNGVADGTTDWNIASTNLSATINGQSKTVGSYQVTYTVTDPVSGGTALDNNNIVKVTSTGKSGDGAANKTIEVVTRFSPILISVPKGNIVARNDVKLGNNTTIDNDVSKIFVWTGGAITNNSGADLDNTSGIFSSSLSTTPQLLPDDPLLSTTLNSSKYFRAFFGADGGVIKQLATVVNGSDTNFASKLSESGKFFWLTGNVTLNGTYGGSTTNPGPVIIFVDSTATLVLNGATINGLLYVDQAWTHSNPTMSTINGALIVNGGLTVVNSGKLTINYNKTNILDKLPKYIGVYSQVAGSWQEK